jgi:hypothetical protein
MYVLGACFGVKWLERKYRAEVVKGYAGWLHSGLGQRELKLLIKWAPEKLPQLLHDAVEVQHTGVKLEMKRIGKEVAEQLSAADEDFGEMDGILRSSREVIAPI